jgi:MerR family transcriptional regulator/heat shock protein HspR
MGRRVGSRLSRADAVRERTGARKQPRGPDASRPVYIISVAAELVSVHPRTLRIYEGEGLVSPARTPSNIRLYSENDLRRILWIRHLTQNLGVNLAGVRVLFELEERLGMRLLEQLYSEPGAIDSSDGRTSDDGSAAAPDVTPSGRRPPNPDQTAKEI